MNHAEPPHNRVVVAVFADKSFCHAIWTGKGWVTPDGGGLGNKPVSWMSDEEAVAMAKARRARHEGVVEAC